MPEDVSDAGRKFFAYFSSHTPEQDRRQLISDARELIAPHLVSTTRTERGNKVIELQARVLELEAQVTELKQRPNLFNFAYKFDDPRSRALLTVAEPTHLMGGDKAR